MGEDAPRDERHRELELDPDALESPFVLPPVDRPPLASRQEKAQAVLRVIAQAERERAADG